MHETICVRGAPKNVAQLATAIRESQVEGIEVSVPLPTKGNLLSRAPLGQFGLVEILISVASSMVSSAAYDGIKRIIADFSKDGKVEVVKAAPKSEPTPKSERGRAKSKTAKSEASKKRLKK
jgi:hypothetical protein